MWGGAAALLMLFVPTGWYLASDVSSSTERSLEQRGRYMANTLAAQIVEPTLLKDWLALHEALQKAAASGDGETRYLCVVSPEGNVLSHTFEGGYPGDLVDLWRNNKNGLEHFRSSEEPLVDLAAPILGGQLGTLHVGLSRGKATVAAKRLIRRMAIALTAAMATIFIGSYLVAVKIGAPLRQLENNMRRFPDRPNSQIMPKVSGTKEVESLGKSFMDMADRFVSLERDRAAAERQMIHAERLAALGELAAGLAHEVHNPLDGMSECLRFLEADPDKSERGAKYYPMLQDGLSRIARVMREMLSFARLGQETAVEPCPVVDVLARLELLVRPQMKGRKIRLIWQTAGPCACLCNERGLSQAALNLILNGAEAAENSDAPCVRIEAVCNAQWVHISVDDSGAGVPEEVREHVFDPFFTTKSLGKGTGLGLSVSRQLIRAAGGDLDLSPEPGVLGGARFVIHLPKVARSREDYGQEPC